MTRRGLLSSATGLALAGAMEPQALAVSGLRTPPRRPARAIVLGHRGAPAHRPEHTLASYAKAIADGADFIEPDLVPTRDGVLIARHENNIAETTDVSARPEFASRRTEKTVDGMKQVGWFTEDFTFAEIKTLRAIERLGALRPESQGFNGQFQLVSFDEIADFTAAEAAARGRVIGLIPEIKHSTYFGGIGLPMEARLIDRLRQSRYLHSAPLIIQSFEVGNLKALRGRLGEFPQAQLMQLIDDPDASPFDLMAQGVHRSYADMVTPAGLAEIAAYADYVAPPLTALIGHDAAGRLSAPTGVIVTAHGAGLLVGTYTFRPENQFLATDYRDGSGPDSRNPAGLVAEIRRFVAAGVDAFFTDDPALGRIAVDGGAVIPTK